MFAGTDEDLRQTAVTQPAIFIHSVLLAKSLGADFQPDMVAGHSWGEFSALVAAGALSFEDGLRLVAARARANAESLRAHRIDHGGSPRPSPTKRLRKSAPVSKARWSAPTTTAPDSLLSPAR